MHELRLEEIEKVEEIVSNSEITYSHLPDDLVDHICCDVESEMSVGLSFKEAFERVQCKLGDLGLQKIQEDTIILIDQKYKFMKTTMKIFGNVSLAMLGIATIFKIFHWPGAGILLTLGFLFLAVIFFPATIMTVYRKSDKKRPVLYALIIFGGIAFMLGVLFKIQHWPGASIMLTGGWTFLLLFFLPAWFIIKANEIKNAKETIVFLIGVLGVIIFGLANLFKIQHWPGANIMTIVGAVLIVAVFLPIYSVALYKKATYVSGRFIYLIILTALTLILVSLLNVNLSKKVIKSVPLSDKYINIEKKFIESKNNNIYKTLNYYAIEDQIKINLIRHKADSLCNAIYSLKKSLIKADETVQEMDVNLYLNNLDLIDNKYEGGEVAKYLIGENKDGFAYELKPQLEDYKLLISKHVGGNQEVSLQLDKLFPLFDLDEFGELKSWEDRTFKHSLLMNAMVQLSHLERNIRIAENICIKHFISKNEKIPDDVSEVKINIKHPPFLQSLHTSMLVSSPTRIVVDNDNKTTAINIHFKI